VVVVFEIVYVVGMIAASLVVYFRFIDRHLDKALDKMFASWHVQNIKNLERMRELELEN
jgi:vacuolar-type H+-ATPase subunit C/Vma6